MQGQWTYAAELLQPSRQLCDLEFCLLVVVALSLQLVFHLVQHLHHVVFLLILCLALPLFFVKTLLQALMFWREEKVRGGIGIVDGRAAWIDDEWEESQTTECILTYSLWFWFWVACWTLMYPLASFVNYCTVLFVGKYIKQNNGNNCNCQLSPHTLHFTLSPECNSWCV